MTGGGLPEAWVAGWRADPGRVVLVDEPSRRAWTAARLDDTTAAMAAALLDAGLRPGDHVVLSSSPSGATVAAYVAVLRAGGVVVPANTAATRRELAHVIDTTGARLAVADDPRRFDGLTATVDVAVLSTSDAARGTSDAVGGVPPVEGGPLDTAAPEDRALVCFTSGTTGRPKGAPLTHANVLAGCRALQAGWHWTPDDVLVSALPLFHVHGLIVAVSTSLTVGARIVVVRRFSPEAVASAVVDHDASMVFGVPTMWARLAEAGALPGLRRLRLAVSGSAPLPVPLFERIRDALGSPPVERYGMSETLILTSTPVDGPRHAGTVGRPLPGVEVRLAADGVVEVRGPAVFAGYLGQPRGEEFTADGWFRTGDIGEHDDDGCLRLVGRASELIITGGYNVYPREVEDVLLAQPGVVDAAVVGLPDEVWGEVVAAVLVAGRGAAGHGSVGDPPDPVGERLVSACEAACETALSPYKRPRRWEVVSALPRNAMGKVDRDALRRSLTAAC